MSPMAGTGLMTFLKEVKPMFEEEEINYEELLTEIETVGSY